MKRCTKCQRELSSSAFNRDAQKPDGLYSQCRECQAAGRDREAQRVRMQAKYTADPEKYRERTRQWRAAHPEAWAAIEARRRSSPEYQAKIAARNARYRANPVNRERKRQRERDNREQIRAQYAAWQKANRARVAAYSAVRRERKAQNGGSFTPDEWEELKARYDYRCLMCGEREPIIKLGTDHVIPVLQGGSSDIDNIQPLCLSCNGVKGQHTWDFR